MNVATITMPQNTARAKYLEYRRAVRANPQANDEILMRGYREIARGRKVLDLSSVLPAAGFCSRGLPRLAVSRADAKRVRCHFNGRQRGPGLTIEPMGVPANVRSSTRVFFFPHAHFSQWPVQHPYEALALVPMIPPDIRPADSLENYHILWEAEWSAKAPVDPLLLKHISGPLFAILAQWDLTDLERAVMAGALG